MLRVTLEVVPFGQEVVKRTLGVLEISNSGGPDEAANYRYILSEFDLDSLDPASVKTGEFMGFDRKRRAWSLVKEILKCIFTDGKAAGTSKVKNRRTKGKGNKSKQGNSKSSRSLAANLRRSRRRA